jgi:hypothetical protein
LQGYGEIAIALTAVVVFSALSRAKGREPRKKLQQTKPANQPEATQMSPQEERKNRLRAEREEGIQNRIHVAKGQRQARSGGGTIGHRDKTRGRVDKRNIKG